MPDFQLVLRGYGYECVSTAAAGLASTADDELLAAAKSAGFEFLLSLDNNRQQEVWSRLLLRLAEGDGRLIRIKIPGTAIPDVPTLTAYWSRAYPAFQRHLRDPRYVIIQVGLSATSSRLARGGFEAYTRKKVGSMVQQQMNWHQGRLLVPGSPRVRAPDRRR